MHFKSFWVHFKKNLNFEIRFGLIMISKNYLFYHFILIKYRYISGNFLIRNIFFYFFQRHSLLTQFDFCPPSDFYSTTLLKTFSKMPFKCKKKYLKRLFWDIYFVGISQFFEKLKRYRTYVIFFSLKWIQ